MKIEEFKQYFIKIINELESSQDSSSLFRIRNYKKWLKLLNEIYIDINTEYDISSLKLPDNMQEKMLHIFRNGNLNIKIDGKESNIKISQSQINTMISLKPKYNLCDFYGFGDATSKKFEAEGITGDDLIYEWQNYIKLNSDNTIIMLSKREKPKNITITKWNELTENQRHDKIYNALVIDLELHSRYLHKLNYHQLIGVKHYFNIMKKIPRSEMIQIENVMKKLINMMNPKLILTICGSYRRGRLESGDIDCLITHKDIISHDNSITLSQIIKVLTQCNLLVDHLTENGGTKYMGICQVGEIPRRIDIRIIPWESYVYSILYFTGSKNNNTQMRNIAKRMGYKLNEYCLENILDHKLVICNTEEEIYKFLGMKYLEPNERDL